MFRFSEQRCLKQQFIRNERRAKPFSLSPDSLFFDLRMASIIIIMKLLGRDSESIASYRTFHNQARANERTNERASEQASVFHHRIRAVGGESKSLPLYSFRSFVRSSVHQISSKEGTERTVFSRNRTSEKLVCLGKSEIGETLAARR